MPKRKRKQQPTTEPPAWLEADAIAAAEWRRVRAALAALGRPIDPTTLAAYARSYSRWRQAEADVDKYGPVLKSPNGYPVQSVYLQIANKALDQLTKLLRNFGLTTPERPER